MKIHYLMHVPFEGLGAIEPWAVSREIRLSRTRLYAGERLPDPDSVDALVIMGGPMSTGDHDRHPWIIEEKRFLEWTLRRDTPTLGVCLGAQLLADVLGARVFRNREREIGWFPVELTREALSSPLFREFPPRFDAFHWHGDTFELPDGAFRIGSSEACENQGFVLGKAVALQFHLESQPSGAEDLCRECADEIVPSPFVQSAEAMLADPAPFAGLQAVNHALLENLFMRDVDPPDAHPGQGAGP